MDEKRTTFWGDVVAIAIAIGAILLFAAFVIKAIWLILA